MKRVICTFWISIFEWYYRWEDEEEDLSSYWLSKVLDRTMWRTRMEETMDLW